MSDLPDFNAEEVEMTEVIEHTEPTTERGAARRVALQVLYEVDCAHHLPGEVLTARLAESETDLSRKTVRYLTQLVQGVVETRSALDAVIQPYAPEWPLEQVAIIDRNILRLALYELIHQERIPVAVVISEAVELAALFGAEGAPRFVNGVLAAMANDVASLRERLKPPQEV